MMIRYSILNTRLVSVKLFCRSVCLKRINFNLTDSLLTKMLEEKDKEKMINPQPTVKQRYTTYKNAEEEYNKYKFAIF